MYLSALQLNPRHPKAIRTLSDVHEMHSLLWRAFPQRKDTSGESQAGRVLYRIESLSTLATLPILVQSEHQPDWSSLCEMNGLLLKSDSKLFDPLITKGQLLRFRIRANPTMMKTFQSQNGVAEKRRIGIYSEEGQSEWFARKAEEAGFSPLDLRFITAGNLTGKKLGSEGAARLQFHSVDFEGVLRVDEPALFLKALENGIGSGKAFGFGLLSVGRA